MRWLTPRNCYSPAMLVHHRTQTVSFLCCICFGDMLPTETPGGGGPGWCNQETTNFPSTDSRIFSKLQSRKERTIHADGATHRPNGPKQRERLRDRKTLKPIPKICRKGNLLRKPSCIVYKYLCFYRIRTNTYTSCIHMSNKTVPGVCIEYLWVCVKYCMSIHQAKLSSFFLGEILPFWRVKCHHMAQLPVTTLGESSSLD